MREKEKIISWHEKLICSEREIGHAYQESFQKSRKEGQTVFLHEFREETVFCMNFENLHAFREEAVFVRTVYGQNPYKFV